MNVYSPIYNNLLSKKKGYVDIKELKKCYKDGIGLGLDLLKPIEGKSIEIFKCPKSKYIFFSPSSLAGDAEYYKKLEDRNSSYYKSESWEFYKTFSLIENKSEKILEIGSGNLSFLKLIRNKSKSIAGLELNENAVMYGKKEGIDVYNTPIEDFSKANKEKFDIVCAFQVLEHIQNVDSFIKASLHCLKKNGRFIVAVPNNKSIFFKKRNLLKYYSNQNNYRLHCTTIALNSPPHHMGLWDAMSLKRLSKRYHMKVKSLHFEPVKEFRYRLIKDILICHLSRFIGLKTARFLVHKFLRMGIVKKLFFGDSILIVFQKV